jgi:hypothetical protein
MPSEQMFSYVMSYIRWDDDDDVRLVLDQHAQLNFYSASSLKQQSEGRHVASLEHIMLIPWCELSGEATNTNCIVFGFTSQEPTPYQTRGEHKNHYTTDAVSVNIESQCQQI